MSALDDFLKFIENGSVLTDPIDATSSMHINAYYDHYFLEDAKRSLADIRTRIAELEWQPIETAPKDKVVLVTWKYHKYPKRGIWLSKKNAWCYFRNSDEFRNKPDYWMPLPKPPELP